MKPAIDLDHLNRYVFGDSELLEEILSIFDEQAAFWLDRLDPALPDESWRDAAHTLKGASRGIGSWGVAELCEHAETLVGGAPEKTAKRRALLQDLRKQLGAAKKEAQRLRADLRTPGSL